MTRRHRAFSCAAPERAGRHAGTCLYELRIDGADLVLRFPRDWLGDWRPLAGGLDRMITDAPPTRGGRGVRVRMGFGQRYLFSSPGSSRSSARIGNSK